MVILYTIQQPATVPSAHFVAIEATTKATRLKQVP